MEISYVRNLLKKAIEQARQRAQTRRQRAAEAERAFATFLETVGVPVTKQVANALKAEGHAFTVFTPGDGLRLAADRSRDDYVDIALDTSGDRPQIVARISRTRGSRTIEEERPLKAGVAPDALTEPDVLDFWLEALEPWLER